MDQKEESLSHLTRLAIEAILEAGEILRRGFGSSFSITPKEGRHNLVTEYDHLSEESILHFICQNDPDARFLAEESGKSGESKRGHLWIVDPLDGTGNFAHQIPIFSISIALEIGSDLFSGVIYQPITHELFVAEKGKGAFLNGAPIKVSTVSDLPHAFLATGFTCDFAKLPEACIDPFFEVLKIGSPVRRLGSAAINLAYIAAGRLDCLFEIGLKPWDYAAGKLLVEEAGGRVSEWDGSSFDVHAHRPILASNGPLHPPIMEILNRK